MGREGLRRGGGNELVLGFLEFIGNHMRGNGLFLGLVLIPCAAARQGHGAHGFSPSPGQVAMGQSQKARTQCTSDSTTKIGSKKGAEFTYQPKRDPKTALTTAAKSSASPEAGCAARRRRQMCTARSWSGGPGLEAREWREP